MGDVAKKLEQQVLDLPEEDRGRIALRLISSLDSPSPEAQSRAEIEQAWVDEAQRRAAQIDSGEVQLIDSDEVLTRLRARLG